MKCINFSRKKTKPVEAFALIKETRYLHTFLFGKLEWSLFGAHFPTL